MFAKRRAALRAGDELSDGNLSTREGLFFRTHPLPRFVLVSGRRSSFIFAEEKGRVAQYTPQGMSLFFLLHHLLLLILLLSPLLLLLLCFSFHPYHGAAFRRDARYGPLPVIPQSLSDLVGMEMCSYANSVFGIVSFFFCVHVFFSPSLGRPCFAWRSSGWRARG